MPRRIVLQYVHCVLLTRRLYTPEETAIVLTSRVLLERAVKAGWLAPTMQRHRLTRYRASDVDAVAAWIAEGNFPGEADPPPRAAPPAIGEELRQRRRRGQKLRPARPTSGGDQDQSQKSEKTPERNR